MTETVRLSGVGFGYVGAPDVLRDVNLILPRGSFHFLTGPSGAGKSSLLRLLTLADQPRTGTLRLFGSDVTRIDRRDIPAFRRRMGVVFQDFRLLDHLSAFDNVALPLRLAGGSEAEYADDVREMLKWVGLGRRMDARPPALSGGEKQRLAIARAVVNRPEILLADEPTGNVDPEMGLRILKLFVELNRLGTTVLFATHDEDLVARSGMPVLHLENGRLTAHGARP